jgi:hypothetical protein
VVTILLGDGKGDIAGPVDTSATLPAFGGLAGSAAADFNGDGKLDAAVAQFTQNGQEFTYSISVLPGNGDGTFQQAVTTPMSMMGLGQMVAEDFNGDGKVDIATGGSAFGIAVVLGNGYCRKHSCGKRRRHISSADSNSATALCSRRFVPGRFQCGWNSRFSYVYSQCQGRLAGDGLDLAKHADSQFFGVTTRLRCAEHRNL